MGIKGNWYLDYYFTKRDHVASTLETKPSKTLKTEVQKSSYGNRCRQSNVNATMQQFQIEVFSLILTN